MTIIVTVDDNVPGSRNKTMFNTSVATQRFLISAGMEKAMARFNIAPAESWLVGDQLRDMQAAEKVGVKGILVGPHTAGTYVRQQQNLWEAARFITAKV